MLPLDIEERFQLAAHSSSPAAGMHLLAKELCAEGVSQKESHRFFMRKHEEHCADQDETTFDAIAGTLDFVVGWCDPFKMIYSKVLTDEDLDEDRDGSV